MTTIYLDTCALNRLTDDLSQVRIRREAEAVAHILNLAFTGEISWIASTVLERELAQNPDAIRRADALSLLPYASVVIAPATQAEQRAMALSAAGLGAFDALHLATAEQERVDALLTTDDRFLKRAQALAKTPRPEILNPLDWLQRRQPWLLPKTP